MKRYILLIMLLFLPTFVFADWNQTYKSFSFLDSSYRIWVYSTNSSDPMTFDDIYQYFLNNPMDKEWSLPTQVFGGDPYELVENNSENWFGLEGMSDATDDFVNFTFNNASIYSTVLSLPTVNETPTRVRSSDYINFYIYLPDTSMFEDGDEIVLQGHDYYNFECTINSISANVYISCPKPHGFPLTMDDTSPPATTRVTVPQAIVFNDDLANAYFGVSMADKFKFAIKSNTTTGKLTHVVLRNYYGSGTTGDRLKYGAYHEEDITLSSDWTNFSLHIRNMTAFQQRDADVPASRGYWDRTMKVYFLFENMSIGDNTSIDGVRYIATDRNPEKIGDNAFIFKTGLQVSSYFRDKGFYYQSNLLDNYGKTSYYEGQYIYATTLGDIQLGDYDYDNEEHEGAGTIFFNSFCGEDSGSIKLHNVKAQGLTIRGPKGAYGIVNLLGENTVCRDCNFVNILNFMENRYWTLEGGTWSGGRYFYANYYAMYINKFTIYGTTGYQLWPRPSGTHTMRNLKIIDNTLNKLILFTYDYDFTEDLICGTYINLDISETNNPIYQSNNRYTSYGCTPRIGFSIDLTVAETNGSGISNANVSVLDRNGALVFNATTDAEGKISTQDVIILEGYNVGPNKFFVFDTPTVDWTYYNPFTLTITKKGYVDYSLDFLETYDKNNTIIKKGMDWSIVLEKPIFEWIAIDDTATEGLTIT